MRLQIVGPALAAISLAAAFAAPALKADEKPNSIAPDDAGASTAFSFQDELGLLKAAAARGDARAQGIISLLWQRAGNGLSDKEAAVGAARSSADVGNPFGQYALARLYSDGLIRKNPAEAAQLGRTAFDGLKRYTEAGDAWARVFEGELLDLGLGIARDHHAAVDRYRDAAENNSNVVAKLDMRTAPAAIDKRNVNRRAPTVGPLKVLILGDSMSLCGFGNRLDRRFRNDRRVTSAFTYMACGTTPLSWIETNQTRAARALCGFWSIESTARGSMPAVIRDLYGPGGKVPKAHPVPNVEKRLETVLPDILLIQTGTNLLGLFGNGQIVRPEQHGPALRKQIAPFLLAAARSRAPLRKIYWVASPTSGRVSREVQDFILAEIQGLAGPAVTVIDSRNLVSYPYREMKADKEHFVGTEMDEWADKVFAVVEQDMVALSLLAAVEAPRLSGRLITSEEAAPPPPPVEFIELQAKLAFKSHPLSLQELLPYQESFVAYVYDVERILAGHYDGKRMLVMHPAHINLKSQPLNFQLGQSYKLEVRELKGSPWETIKSRDDSDAIELSPYVRIEDDTLLEERRGKQ
jgi:hypothetical protein